MFQSLYGSYFQTMRWSRLAMAAFWTVSLLFFLWAIPWLPAGMSVEDYTGPVIFTFSLLGGCVLLGGVAITLRSLAWRRRQALVALTTVYEETTGLRNRRYFLERVALECERSVETKASFAVILFDLALTPEQGGESEEEALVKLMRSAGEVLAKHSRLSDIVAVIGRTELALLASGVSPQAATRAAHRLGYILGRDMETALGKARYQLGLRVGVAPFGSDTGDAGSLLRAARTGLTPVSLEGSPQAGETAQADAA
jgi:diguanylate cyclase (GGDEF)-like protein